jgi:hypothetical protein
MGVSDEASTGWLITTTTNRKAYRHRLELAYLLQRFVLYQQIPQCPQWGNHDRCLVQKLVSPTAIL